MGRLPSVNKIVHWDGAGTVECVPVLITGLSYGQTHSGAPTIEGVLYDDDPHPARFPSEPVRWHYPEECPRSRITLAARDPRVLDE